MQSVVDKLMDAFDGKSTYHIEEVIGSLLDNPDNIDDSEGAYGLRPGYEFREATPKDDGSRLILTKLDEKQSRILVARFKRGEGGAVMVRSMSEPKKWVSISGDADPESVDGGRRRRRRKTKKSKRRSRKTRRRV